MAFPWHDVIWVLLDMDGTLLDKHFDDYFWESLVPQEYARRQGLTLAKAREEVFSLYKREEGTLNWTDIDYWSQVLDLDIPALKESIGHLIEVHPDARDFLQYVRGLGKKVILVTNAHYKTLDLKMNHTGLLRYFDEVVSSFDLGMPKEDLEFWKILEERLGFDRNRAMLVDDNADVLAAARNYGIKYLVFKAKSSSQESPEAHPEFASIVSFKELME